MSNDARLAISAANGQSWTRIISTGGGRPERPDGAADLQRPFEDGADPQPAGQPMAADGAESGRGDTPTVRAVGRAAELARRDVTLEVGGDAGGGLREDAFFGILRRLVI